MEINLSYWCVYHFSESFSSKRNKIFFCFFPKVQHAVTVSGLFSTTWLHQQRSQVSVLSYFWYINTIKQLIILNNAHEMFFKYILYELTATWVVAIFKFSSTTQNNAKYLIPILNLILDTSLGLGAWTSVDRFIEKRFTSLLYNKSL